MADSDRRLASRKFMLASAALVASVALCACGRLTGAEFVELARWLLGLYLAGNVAASAVHAYADRAPRPDGQDGVSRP